MECFHLEEKNCLTLMVLKQKLMFFLICCDKRFMTFTSNRSLLFLACCKRWLNGMDLQMRQQTPLKPNVTKGVTQYRYLPPHVYESQAEAMNFEALPKQRCFFKMYEIFLSRTVNKVQLINLVLVWYVAAWDWIQSSTVLSHHEANVAVRVQTL